MFKFIKAFCLTIILSIYAFPQTNDEYNKNEFFVGYSNQQVDVGDNGRTFHGFEVSYTRNINRYFGIKADVSGAYRNSSSTYQLFNGTVTDTVTTQAESSVYNFLGGVQVKDNATKARFKPFAHALVGVAHTRAKFDTFCATTSCSNQTFVPNTFKRNDTGFGGAFGGGLDIKINNRIDFRALQVDYNPVYTGSSFDNNVRFGIGFVFK